MKDTALYQCTQVGTEKKKSKSSQYPRDPYSLSSSWFQLLPALWTLRPSTHLNARHTPTSGPLLWLPFLPKTLFPRVLWAFSLPSSYCLLSKACLSILCVSMSATLYTSIYNSCLFCSTVTFCLSVHTSYVVWLLFIIHLYPPEVKFYEGIRF